MAHFAKIFFRFFSMIIWQGLYNNSNNVNSMTIQDDNLFWKVKKVERVWLFTLINETQQLINHKFIQPSSCLSEPHKSYWRDYREGVLDWFLHPSDAILLSSLLVDADPCYLHGTSDKLLASPLQIVLLSRKHDRLLLNKQEVLKHLRIEYGYNASVVFLEHHSFRQQVQIMRGIDVFIAVHGAGTINVAWMRPCSIVIEVLPWGYNNTIYFGSLSVRTGLLYYNRYSRENDTIFTNVFNKRPSCRQTLSDFRKVFLSKGDEQLDWYTYLESDMVGYRARRY